ncbi:MAG: metalloregulator ArsR/SmtB family transcription factor [Candidatus Nanopelagicales bacterium]|nr:helix-turn-helix transcriptional regulator [Actinomycetota bacterium]
MTTSVREITPVDPARVEQVRKSGLKADHATALSGTLSLLAEPTRLRILYALDQVDEMCVGDLALALGCGEDAASYALRLLRTAGLVTSRKQGRTVFYRLAPDFPEPLLNHCWVRLVDLSQTTKDDL